jgi:hypothetical protein
MNSNLHDDPERTTAIGLARYASEFMEAAMAADEKMGDRKGFEIIPPTPVLFLIGQSLELILKSFLAYKNVPLVKLRKNFKHNINRLLEESKELGLEEIINISDEDQNVINLLNDLYSSKQLQYIVTGYKKYPSNGVLEKFVLNLIYAVGREVGYQPSNLAKPYKEISATTIN